MVIKKRGRARGKRSILTERPYVQRKNRTTSKSFGFSLVLYTFIRSQIVKGIKEH
ncbi:hypothetical protein JOD43_003966 [Pullulanibacillus pueri]|nr:hypothetical protein [Pullulanibacillus pueri]